MTRARRFLGLAAATVVALELVSLVASSIREGQLVLWSGWQARRAEVIERFDPTRAAAPSDASEDSTRRDVIHPYIGFVVDPSRVSTINEYGFPGLPDPLVKRSPGRVNVALLGGFPALTLATEGRQALTRELGGDVAVVCLAHPEYKQPQQLMALSYMLVLGAEFDLVINIDGFNEVALHQAGNAYKRVYPVYPANWYLYTSSAPDPNLRRLIGHQAYVEGRMVARARRYSRAPWRYSLTLNALWGWRQRAASALHAALGEQMRTFATRDAEQLPYWVQGPPIAFANQGQLYDLLASVWQSGSLQLSRLARKSGMRYLHVLQPDPRAAGSGALDAVYEPGVRMGYPRLVEAGKQLASQGVRFIDLSGETSERGASLYRDGRCRLTPEGIELLARRIGRALVEE